MNEGYDATYVAISRAVGNCDISAAVTAAIQSTGIEIHVYNIASAFQNSIWNIESEMCRPSVLYRPRLSIDGDQYCALYGENLQDGVAGFGQTPAEAMSQFDIAWRQALASAKGGAA